MIFSLNRANENRKHSVNTLTNKIGHRFRKRKLKVPAKLISATLRFQFQIYRTVFYRILKREQWARGDGALAVNS